ncbi:unnamed protein product [Heterobilharzia americana]|nr:unnamed protein product [Heterobilharzia americana]
MIEYAQYQNPKEFELSKDLMPSIKLPGSYKTLTERKNKNIIELENGIIPQPVRRCYVCIRTCFYAPLLPCDYCSACYHLECLNPPLSYYPSRYDRWMCPNHTEHTTERYIIQSIRLTERMRIWNMLSKKTELSSIYNNDNDKLIESSEKLIEILEHHTPPYELTYTPDEESIILSDLMRTIQRNSNELEQYYLCQQSKTVVSSILDSILYTSDRCSRKVYNPRDLWRLNRQLTAKRRNNQSYNKQLRIVVPKAVKCLYNNPVKRIPRVNEAMRTTTSTTISMADVSNADEKNIFIRGLLQFYLQNTLDERSSEGNSPPSIEKITTDTTTSELLPLSPPSLLQETSSSNPIQSLNISQSINDSTEMEITYLPTSSSSSSSSLSLPLQSTTTVLCNNEEKLTDNNVKEENVEHSHYPLHLCTSVDTQRQEIVDDTDIDILPSKLACLDPQLIYTLAAQRIRHLFGINYNVKDELNILLNNSAFINSVLLKNKDKWCISDNVKKDISKNSHILESCIRARAVLSPCDNTNGSETRMLYRQLTIGSSPNCHLCLTNYHLSSSTLINTECCFISSHHATIFYDDWTQHYELINYSEYGTRVDGIVYGNDIESKSIYISKSSDLVHRVRNLINSVPEEISPSEKPTISGLRTSPPKRVMKMLSRRHEELYHMTSLCDCTSLYFNRDHHEELHQTSLPLEKINMIDDNSMWKTTQRNSNNNNKVDRREILSGWEGSAILRHGSIIQVGCYKFVFGIINYSLPPPSSSSSCILSSNNTLTI